MRQLVCLDPPCLGCVACRSGELPLSEDLQDEVGFRMLRAVEPRWTGRGGNLHRDRVILAYSRTLKRLDVLLTYLYVQTSAAYGKTHATTRRFRTVYHKPFVGGLRGRAENMLAFYVTDPPCMLGHVFFGPFQPQAPDVKYFGRPLPKRLPIESQQLLAEATDLIRALPRRTRIFADQVYVDGSDTGPALKLCSTADLFAHTVLPCLQNII
jgi:hypothetical protein